MAFISTASHVAFDGAASAKSPVKAPAKRGFFRRLLASIEQANTRRAEREIARHFAIDGKFTDEVERSIERRFLNMR
jgi:hypothetical protein